MTLIICTSNIDSWKYPKINQPLNNVPLPLGFQFEFSSEPPQTNLTTFQLFLCALDVKCFSKNCFVDRRINKYNPQQNKTLLHNYEQNRTKPNKTKTNNSKGKNG